MSNEEQVRKIKEKLEELVNTETRFEREIFGLPKDELGKFKQNTRQSSYVSTINCVYKIICDEFGIPYSPIKSELSGNPNQ